MKHIQQLESFDSALTEEFKKKLTGKYYTHEDLASHMNAALLNGFSRAKCSTKKIEIVDPFAGDGRLVVWFIEAYENKFGSNIDWIVKLVDSNSEGLQEAESLFNQLIDKGISISLSMVCVDSFKYFADNSVRYDVVVTNPPWEMIKPDRRELAHLALEEREKYVQALKQYDHFLSLNYPVSQPKRKFAGWGTNLSRVGAELAYRLCKDSGFVGIVLPASFYADDQSAGIRSKYLSAGRVLDIAYFPAEAKLFGKVDAASSSTVIQKSKSEMCSSAQLTVFDKFLNISNQGLLNYDLLDSKNEANVIPISLGVDSAKLIDKMQSRFPSWRSMELEDGKFWSGREIDETGKEKWLVDDSVAPNFIKGKMINRYCVKEFPQQSVVKPGWKRPPSCAFDRLAWRDVSRPNQKRRVIAAVIPKGTIAGNSLSIACFIDDDPDCLLVLLAIFNSLCFEFQLRCYLATGHISLSAVRKVHLPSRAVMKKQARIVREVSSVINKESGTIARLEALIAKDLYGLDEVELDLLMNAFDKLEASEKQNILREFRDI
jgi:Alw26I/Eco31I/Esp3I family type II restriction m6 adenine DNA methyltransferase